MIQGIKQELMDCSFELLDDIQVTTSVSEAFKDSDFNLMMTMVPKLSHLSINEWLYANAEQYREYGKAIDSSSKRSAKTLIAKGPICTNSLALQSNAPDMPIENFSGLSRLTQNRAKFALAARIGYQVRDVQKVAVWGNCSYTIYPDIRLATLQDTNVLKMVEESWITSEFVPHIRQRGPEIVELRKFSSAASIASATMD